MWTLIGTFFYCIGSALVPVLNAEVYVAAIGQTHVSGVWIALAAAAGQMIGKLGWYWAGAGSTRVPWLARKLAEPAWAERLEGWRQQTQGRPVFTVGLYFVSAFTGFPPFAVLSALGGLLGVRIWHFLVAGFAGRFLRFLVVVYGTDTLLSWFGW